MTPHKRSYDFNECVNVTCEEAYFTTAAEETLRICCKYRYSFHNYYWEQQNWKNNRDTLTSKDFTCSERFAVETMDIQSHSQDITITSREPGYVGVYVQCSWQHSQNPECSRPPQPRQSVPGQRVGQTWQCQRLQPNSVYQYSFMVKVQKQPRGQDHFSSWYYSGRYSDRYRDRYRDRYTGKPKYREILGPYWANTTDSVPDKPELVAFEDNLIEWRALPGCKGTILQYKLTLAGERDYTDAPTPLSLMFPPNQTRYVLGGAQPGTRYSLSLSAQTSTGWGPPTVNNKIIPIGVPPVPDESTLKVTEVTKSAALLSLTPVTPTQGPISAYQIIVSVRQSWAVELKVGELQRICEKVHLTSSVRRDEPYVAMELSVHSHREFVVGNGQTKGIYQNPPLQPNSPYIIILRVVSQGQWNKERKYSCVPFPPFYTRAELRVVVTITVLLVLVGGLTLGYILYRRKHPKKRVQQRSVTLTPLITPPKHSRRQTVVRVNDLLMLMIKMKKEEFAAAEGDDEEGDVGLNKEYRTLPFGCDASCAAGAESYNIIKNRYRNILPYDKSRVLLNGSNKLGSDYINASHIQGYKQRHQYIATQGPLAETIADFWQMIWEQNSTVIIMLTNLVEQGKDKCEQYWPELGTSQTYGNFTITFTSLDTKPPRDFITRNLDISKGGCPVGRRVKQFHFLLWPDHGSPSHPLSVYRLLQAVNRDQTPTQGPLVIHCSAGIGRTGTMIAIDYLLAMGEEETKVDVWHCVHLLRQQRAGLVQSSEQYRMIYWLLLEVLVFGDTAIVVPDLSRCLQSLTAKDPVTGHSGYSKELKLLDQYSQLYKSYSYKEAMKACNTIKNRFTSILPADHVRPNLMSVKNVDGSPGYINAAFADAYGKPGGFVLVGWPLSHTLADLWALVHDYRCASIICLTRDRDLDQTYPSLCPEVDMASYGPFQVRIISNKQETGFTLTHLRVSKLNQAAERLVRLVRVQLWPVGSPVPQCPDSLIRLLEELERWQRKKEDPPIIITCRDGVSQSGLFCALSVVQQQLKEEGLVDVFQAVKTVRAGRPQAVPSEDQYMFCYTLARLYIDQFETYANFS